MSDLSEALATAGRLIASGDAQLFEIIALSLHVSLSAVAIAAVIGLPLGALLAVARFPGRRAIILLLNTAMGLPPVVVGLLVYLSLSNSGPLGGFQLLYTPAAMIAAQSILVTPIIASLTRQTIKDLLAEYDEQLRAFGLSAGQRVATLLYEGRLRLATAMLAGFGRAIAEVGAVIIVGGNINHVTRTMTTAIALETSRGNLALALALGVILLTLSLIVNAFVLALRPRAQRARLFGMRT
ncbi:MAG: ABC transporter permease [Hyphomicrobium sp.]